MQVLNRYISILHEIILDFSFVMLDSINAVKNGYTFLTHHVTHTGKRLWKHVPEQHIHTKKYLPQQIRIAGSAYFKLLRAIYTELEDALDHNSIPLYFILAIVCTLIAGSTLFYVALVF